MTAKEKRQAARIIRNARKSEERFFNLIQELQDAANGDTLTDDYDWQSTLDHLQAIQDELPLLFDLVRNIQREMR